MACRSEKTMLNEINKRPSTKFPVMADGGGARPKDRIAKPTEKIYILVRLRAGPAAMTWSCSSIPPEPSAAVHWASATCHRSFGNQHHLQMRGFAGALDASMAACSARHVPYARAGQRGAR